MKNVKFPTKTYAEIYTEISDVMSGKKRTPGAFMIQQFVKARKCLGENEDTIKLALVREYIIKYGELKTGKKTLKQVQDESMKQINASAKGLEKV
jgi:hypothetical protein